MLVCSKEGFNQKVVEELLEEPDEKECCEEDGVVPGAEESLQNEKDTLHEGVVAVGNLNEVESTESVKVVLSYWKTELVPYIQIEKQKWIKMA